MLYLTCTTITSVDLAHYGLSRAQDRISGDSGTKRFQVKCYIVIKYTVMVEKTKI